MSRFIYINGKILPASEARISVLDGALLHGFGLFETLRAYNGIPFRLGEHLQRMSRSARAFGIPYAIHEASFRRDIVKLLAANHMAAAAVRITLTRGAESVGRSLIVTLRDLPPLAPQRYASGEKLILAAWKRSTSGPLYGHKTLNYLENILARERAERLRAVDVIFTDANNRVLEGSATNLFLVRKGIVATPSLKGCILPGVARKIVISLCRAEKIPVRERAIPLRDLFAADEIFVTNALIEVMPVSSIGSMRVGTGKVGPVAPLLLQRYRELVSREGS
ncbi:MAG: hypothetical protein A2Z34_07790 [Planctomycetes bacterium RBG_16_59_8]|nr:MAG: hypothetical protein A2Z34_07790 [Planctomycetes bacterium RBG_16_59_8]